MTDMILRYRVMPNPESELGYEELENKVKEVVSNYGEKIITKEVKESDVGFGVKACEIEFQLDEKLGSEKLENQLQELSAIGEVIVMKMDRL